MTRPTARFSAPAGGPRAGYTLIELLVVIAIIGILAALTAAAVVRTRERGKDLQVRSAMTQLDTSIAAFKVKFGVSPACVGSGPYGTFKLSSDYPTDCAEKQFLKRCFPRMLDTDNGLRWDHDNNVNTASIPIPFTQPILLDPNQCLVVFTCGGEYTSYNGMCANPERPFDAVGARIPSLLDFPQDRMLVIDKVLGEIHPTNASDRFPGDNAQSRFQKWFCDPWGVPYLYMTSNNGNDYPFGNNSMTGLQIFPFGGADTPEAAGFFPFREANNRFSNPKTHQLVSAGPNGPNLKKTTGPRGFGPGSKFVSTNVYDVYVPNAGQYAGAANGEDDLANFRGTKLGAGE